MKAKNLIAISLGLGIAFAAGVAKAFPDGPITIVVPFPPGGATDTTARLMEPQMSKVLGANIVVENKPGATGAIGAGLVADAEANGQTLLVASLGTIATKPNLQKKLSNQQVLAKAPEAVVDEQRERLAEEQSARAKLDAALKRLSAVA